MQELQYTVKSGGKSGVKSGGKSGAKLGGGASGVAELDEDEANDETP